MRHIILASHHRFADGLRDTLEFIGGVENLHTICAFVDDQVLEDQVAQVFAGFDPDDEVLVLTDIMQGSVNQAFAPYMGPHVYLVAGVNVALALELCLWQGPLTPTDIEQSIEAARQSMCFMNAYATQDDEDDE